MDGVCRCFSGWSGLTCDIPVPVMHTASLTSVAFSSDRDGTNRGSPGGTNQPITVSGMPTSSLRSDFTPAVTQLDEQAIKGKSKLTHLCSNYNRSSALFVLLPLFILYIRARDQTNSKFPFPRNFPHLVYMCHMCELIIITKTLSDDYL